MRNVQSSRAVPETGVDSGVASASVRPEPSSVDAAGRLADLTLGLNEATRAEIAKLFTDTLSEAQAIVMSMIFMPGVRAALDNLPADDPVGPYLEKARQYEAKDRELAEAGSEVERLRRERDHWKFGHDASERARDEAQAALREKEEALEKAQRTIGHRDRRIARLWTAIEGARAKGYRLPAEDEPPVVLSSVERPCPHAPTYDAGLCCGHPDDCTFIAPPRSVLSSVQPVSGSREQRGNEEVR